MSSFISSLKPFLLAALAVLLIEGTVYRELQPNMARANNLLDLAYPEQELLSRAIFYEKLTYFYGRHPDIIQIGDSSGLMGIRGDIVEEYLPEGTLYANLSCCATLGYRGPLGTMKFALRTNPNLKMIVLYQSPAGNYPRKANNITHGDAWFELGNRVYDQLAGVRRFANLPSLAFRRRITELAYYLTPYRFVNAVLDPDRPITKHLSFDLLRSTIGQNRGFIPDPETHLDLAPWGDMPECVFDYEEDKGGLFGTGLFSPGPVSYVEETYSAFAELARAYGVKLMIVHQVVPCPLGTGEGSRQVRAAIERFHTAYPEVSIPFDIVDEWPKEKFAVAAHVRGAYTPDLSRRLGQAVGAFYAR